ncbi:hypothetical protein PRIPAC_91777, partial [Pristionchus pacificus]
SELAIDAFPLRFKEGMGNEGSTLIRRLGKKNGRREKEKAIEICNSKSETVVVPIYKKKARRVSSSSRFASAQQIACEKKQLQAVVSASPGTPPTPHRSIPILRSIASSPDMKDPRRSSISASSPLVGTPPVGTPTGASSLLVPNQGKDRRRSRSLCQSTMQSDVQEVVAKHSSGGSRKSSSAGLVPQLNRLRIQQCYKTAKPSMGELIMKRASASRPDFRGFLYNLEEDQLNQLSESTYVLITDAVENIERSEKVLAHATRYGESFVALCPLGFRPDLFSVLADAAIAECVRLDGGAHKRCETLLAWSQLFAAIFSSVRDGYYQRIRYQRRSSLPQYAAAVVRQQSIENSNPNSRRSSSRCSQDE